MSGHIPHLFGAHYFLPNSIHHFVSSEADPYSYEVYVGKQSISVNRGDCVYMISSDKKSAALIRGAANVSSEHFAVLIRGFAPENKTSSVTNGTVLPYVNGCSTKQIFPPDRPGDPTLQMLHIPPFSSEQVHHIHSTTRAVYVLSGEGKSVVGMKDKSFAHPLIPGTVAVLERMCPHHFETGDQGLTVLPVHVWSSVPSAEHNHPMYNGTFTM